MHPLLHQRRDQIIELCREYAVRRLEVFGSAARAHDFQVDHSDFDFAVEFSRGFPKGALEEFFGFLSSLSTILGHDVDLTEKSAIKNPYLLKSIDQDVQLVYAA